MPPSAMPSSVSVAIRSASALPVRACRRSRKSTVEAAGNFGAPPKPPHSGSKAERRAGSAPVRSSSVSGSADGATSADRRSDSASSGPRLLHLAAALALGVVHRLEHLAEGRACRSGAPGGK